MKGRWDTAITGALAICAVVTTGVVVHREMFGSSASAVSATAEKMPVLIPHWRGYLNHGVRIGSADAPVQLLEFGDYECPFCSSFHTILKILQERYPAQIGVTVLNFPLPMHRFALPAARVAECARDQGRFEAMHDELYKGQDLFGLRPWRDFAIATGIPDLPAFDACINRADSLPLVEAAKQLGAKLDVKGTPTLIVNGWLLSRPPTLEELDKDVKSILAGNNPFGGRGL